MSKFQKDPRQIEQARASAEGRQPRAVPEWDWIPDGKSAEEACLRMLRGEMGLYPIFGIQLAVEERGWDQKFPALVFYDALYGPEGKGLCGALRSGFWVGVSDLLLDPTRGFKTEDRELLILTMLSQPEMQLALATFRKELADERQARQRQQEENRARLLSALRQQFGNNNPPPTAEPAEANTPATIGEPAKGKKAMRPQLGRMADILTASTGSFTYEGIELYVAKAPDGNNAVRLKSTPAGHTFEEIAKKNIFVLQSALMYKGDRPSCNPASYEGNELLRFQLRTWLREALQKDGVTLHEPVDFDGENVGTNGAGHHQDETPRGNALGTEGPTLNS